MNTTRVMIAFGTRPEAVKMAPIVRELQKHGDRVRPIIAVTAQHREMLDQVLQLFALRADYDLNVMQTNQTLTELTCSILQGMERILRRESVDLLLVQGDTTTTLSAALAAFYQRVPVGHVEAGLRTYNKHFPYPEEMNRLLTSQLADVHFAATEQARQNLLREGVGDDRIVVTGNTVIDALLSVVPKGNATGRNNIEIRRMVLVTAHRRESFGEPLEDICRAILDIVEGHRDVEVMFPVHLNPNVRAVVHRLLGRHERIRLTEPMGYADFARTMSQADLILTDSGGVQEEAPALGKPVLVLRNETERQEGIQAGTCRLVGTDRRRIAEEANRLLTNDDAYRAMAQAVNPYGDGEASRRIVEWILNRFGSLRRMPGARAVAV